MRMTLRELFLLTLVTGVAIGWWVDRQHIQKESLRVIRVVPKDFVDVIELARTHSPASSYGLIGIQYEQNGQFDVHLGFRNRQNDRGGGCYMHIVKLDDKWEVDYPISMYDIPPS
jgi:hypothetical protein